MADPYTTATEYMSGTMDALSPEVVNTAYAGHMRPRHMRFAGETGVTSRPANGNGEPGSPDRQPVEEPGASMVTSREAATDTGGSYQSEPLMYEMPRRGYEAYEGRHARLRIELGAAVQQQEHGATQANGRILSPRTGQAPAFWDGLHNAL